MDQSKRVLLVASGTNLEGRVEAALRSAETDWMIDSASDLQAASVLLGRETFDAVLLDAGLSRSGLNNAAKLLSEVLTGAPLLVLADSAELTAAIETQAHGAQDFILKSGLDEAGLGLILEHAILRARQAQSVRRRLREAQMLKSRFEGLIRDNADAVLVLDRGGMIRFANPATGKLFNCDPARLIGTHPGIPIRESGSIEIGLGFSKGQETVVDVRIMRTYWDGEPAYLATLRDISSRKRVESDLLLAKQQAELASETKSTFLAHMSHELRTPLNSIIGFAEMMQQGLFGRIENERYADYVSTINTSATHLLTLINNLLDLSKIEAGREELNEEIIDVYDLLHAVAHAEELTAQEHGLTLDCEIDCLPHLLRVDRVKLDQIVLNLLSNAIKFTPEGGRVLLQGQGAKDGSYVISVTDTGCGMTPEDIPQAFASFAQIRSPYSRKKDRGTGLGLPIARNLSELHDGRLDITSQQGNGTRVTVTLPAERVVDRKVGPFVPEEAGLSA
jgi:signal transduction histidine kinase